MDNKIALQQNTPDRQAGVSLMLAVLVLSAVTAIAFSLTTIVFIELRAASDIVRGEPALYATLGMTEQALFQYKRYVNGPKEEQNVLKVTTCAPVNLNVCKIGSVDFSNKPPVLREYEEVPKLVTINNGSTVSIPLHDGSTYKPRYSKVELQLVPIGNQAGNLEVQVWRMSPSGVASVPETSFFIAESDSVKTTNLSTTEELQYELRLISTGSNTGTTSPKNFLLSITTYAASDSNQKLGIPYVGKRALDVVANYLGVNRTYRVYIPVP